MVITEEEIEKLIKKRNVTKQLMPSFIRELIVEELEDSDDNAFYQGKEEGIAQEREEWKSKDPEEIPGVELAKYEFAIEVLKSTSNIDEKIKELEIEKCRYI